jgi:hypothetical protein
MIRTLRISYHKALLSLYNALEMTQAARAQRLALQELLWTVE